MKINPQGIERKDLEIVAAQICAAHVHESHVEIRKKDKKGILNLKGKPLTLYRGKKKH